MTKELYGIFTPENKTIRDIFDGNNYYRVPDYQRPYSWGDDQIEDLWDDLYSAFDAGDPSYFLGPTILIRRKDGYLEVVDGQQRLTTLTILFCVMRDIYFTKDKRIVNAIRSLVDDKYRLRLITQQSYQNQFEQEILDKVDFPEKKLAKDEKKAKRLLNAAEIFRDKLESLETRRIKAFSDYVFDKVIMIAIVCSDESFAVRLFQVLNTRGLDLSNADLLKSYLYGKLDEDKKRQFMSTWNQVETIVSDMDEELESLFTLYEYYVLGSNPRRSLYVELQNRFRKQDPNKVIWDFKKFAQELNKAINSNPKVVNSFWYLPNQVFWKAILATAAFEKYAQLDLLVRELRRLYYSYWIAGYTTAKVKQLSFNLIRWVKGKKRLHEIRAEIDKKMNEDDVPKGIAEALDKEGYGDNYWLGPLLALIEYEQTDESKVTYIELGRDVHVDHILPQGWQTVKDWRDTWKRDEGEEWLHKIGNLTLLSGRKNIRASKSAFKEKRDIYRGKGIDGITSFIITQRVARKHQWTVKEARRRRTWIRNQVQIALDISF